MKVISVATRTLDKMKLLVLVLLFAFKAVNSYKILGVFPFGSKSHYAIGEATMRALQEAGHEVTMISVLELKKPLANYTQITITDLMQEQIEKNGSRRNPK